jgi:hypothetical protein
MAAFMSTHSRAAFAATAAAFVLLAMSAVAQEGSQPARPHPSCPAEPTRFHPCALEKAKTFEPSRTADGRPDFQGFWRGQPAATENIEAHPKTDDDDGGPTLIVDPADGRIPYQPWALRQVGENRAHYVDPNAACFPSGVPRSMYTPTQIEIRQNASSVVILFERAHTYRIIPTDGPARTDSQIRLWQGDSRGKWEGNTLVVDVTNQNGRAWLDQAGHFYTEAVHKVERFTLIDADTIHYQVTIDDPNVFTKPWTMTFPLRRNRQPGFALLEEACHEGERSTDRLLRLGYKVYPGISRAPAQ